MQGSESAEWQRAHLLEGLRRFVGAAREVCGVRRIAVIGSIATTKPNPKDIDVLVVVAPDVDLAELARHARRLRGHAQSVNRGADVFLADEQGAYIGRTCPWRDCRPGARAACDARHCGRPPHLHDDLDTIALDQRHIASPPVTVWPVVERGCVLPADLEALVASLERAG